MEKIAEVNQFNPLEPGVQNVLLFIQNGLDLGLELNTLKVQVSTDTWWALNPLIEHFLRAVLRFRPPRKSLYPKWDLTVVLNALTNPSFAPTAECALEDITLKAAFLISITLGRRVLKIQALGVQEPYITFFPRQGGFAAHSPVCSQGAFSLPSQRSMGSSSLRGGSS